MYFGVLNIILQRCVLMMLVLEVSVAVRRSAINSRRLRSFTPRPRVLHGRSDLNNEYPFVVTLMADNMSNIKSLSHYKTLRLCTGSLISSQWVVTAEHCLAPVLRFVMRGNTSESSSESKRTSKIIRQIPYPGSQISIPDKNGQYDMRLIHRIRCLSDIGLLQIEKFDLEVYGKLHGADYKTFVGRAVHYAGYGMTFDRGDTKNFWKNIIKDQHKPLQIGEGVISANSGDKLSAAFNQVACLPNLIVSPTCARVEQTCAGGDSGGPVLINNQIIGVLSMSVGKLTQKVNVPNSCVYIPVSPYLDWIRRTINDAL